MIRRALKILALGLLLVILVAVVGLSYLLGTEAGFKQVLALGQRVAPGSLSWQSADGKLIGPLALKGLRYRQDDGLDASVDSLTVDWTPSALLGRELVIDSALIDGIALRLPETAASAETPADAQVTLPDIALPVSVRLDDLAVADVAIFPAGQDTPVEIERLRLGASLDSHDLKISTFEIAAPQGGMQLAGDVQTRGDYPMDLTLDWHTDIAGWMPADSEGSATGDSSNAESNATHTDSSLAGQGTLQGDLATLQIAHRITGVAHADIAASVFDVITAPGWDATFDATLAEPDALRIQALSDVLVGEPALSLQSRGTLDDFQATMAFSVATTETGPVALDAKLSGSTRELDIQSLTARLSESGGEFSARGHVLLETLEGALEGDWQELGWPLVGDAEFRSREGRFEGKGSADAFTLTLATDVSGAAIPDGRWQLALDGSATRLDNVSLRGETLGGTIDGSGTVSWDGTPRWSIGLDTEALNPGMQWADFPGSIDLALTSRGELHADGPELALDIDRLSGSLRGQALAGNAQLRLDGEHAAVGTVQLSLGPSQLVAGGKIDESLSLAFDIASDDLGTLMPGLDGALALTGTVSGDRQSPVIAATGNADSLRFADNRVATLAFTVDGGVGPEVRSTLSLDATDLHAGGQRIDTISLSGEGTQADHRLALAVSSEQGDIATTLEGGYADAAWQGALVSLQIEESPAGNWALRKPVAIVADAEQADASALCLDNAAELGGLCVEGNWQADGESMLLLTLEKLSPALAAEYLPADIRVETALDGQATATLNTEGALSVDSRLVFQPGTLSLDSAGTPLEFGLEKTTVDAAWQDDIATVRLDGAVRDIGSVRVQAAVSDPTGAGELSGQIDVDITDLSLISAVAPQVQAVTGSLTSDLTIAGTLGAPLIDGKLALTDFGAEIPETAMVIEATSLRVTGGRDGTLLIDGQSVSGGGTLGISGTVNPATQALDLAIAGDSYQVANTALIQAVISPDFTVVLDKSGMQVDGTLAIPSAYINANGGNEGLKTVSGSSDVVFVSDVEDAAIDEADSAGSQVGVDMQILLGDSIEIEAGDFRGRVEGDLRVEQSPGTAPRGTGTITVVNGDFVVYGQQLNMERGRILFGGGPVDNPSLDMEVAREVPEFDVVAGARIQGTAQSPRLELYSEPPMPDASILSFILRGQPPDSMGASYTLGKYLTPDLYVSYGIGLFDAINTFNMRYKLTETFSLEAESGGGSSADLIYTIER